MRLRDNAVLVTGASGFIGRHLVQRLVSREGARVRALVRHVGPAVEHSDGDVEVIQGDVTDASALRAACEGCQIVVHCASGGRTREEYMATNVRGAQNVTKAAQDLGVDRVVHLSSIAVHGPSPPPDADESAPLVLTGQGYADSKVKAEEVMWQAWHENRVPVTVIRPTFVWGPGSQWFTSDVLRTMKNGTFALVDEGRTPCHAVYIDNLIEAVVLASTSPQAVGEAFIITDGKQVLWCDFFLQYAAMLGIDELPSINSESLLVRLQAKSVDRLEAWLSKFGGVQRGVGTRIVRRGCYLFWRYLTSRAIPNQWNLRKYARRGGLRIDKARRLLGYAPSIDLESGMRRTLQWVHEHMAEELGLEPLSEYTAETGLPLGQAALTVCKPQASEKPASARMDLRDAR